MLNRVVLIGRWTATPELRTIPSGMTVVNATLAVDRRKKEDGADFINVTVWGKAAEAVAAYTDKGSMVAVDGRIQVGSYEKDGVKHKKFEVVAENIRFLSRKEGGTAPGAGMASTGISFNEDDIPF